MTAPTIANLERLDLNVSVRLLYDHQNRGPQFNPDIHAAQFQFFLTVQNLNTKSKGFSDYYWFGVSLYDNRREVTSLFAMQDVSQARKQGTEKFIYDVPGFPRVLAKDLVTQLVAQADSFAPEIVYGRRVETLDQVPHAPAAREAGIEAHEIGEANAEAAKSDGEAGRRVAAKNDLGASVLPGITRDSVITLARELGIPVVEALVPREMLYIADEVQTGLMRTGELWGIQKEPFSPDIMVSGKGISGGMYPIAAVLASEKAAGWLNEDGFGHISTGGGSELGCIVGMKVLEICGRPEVRSMVHYMAERFQQGLRQIAVIGQQHQPFAVEIEPADGKHAHGDTAQKILHGRPAAGIVQRRHNVLGLVQHQIHERLGGRQMFAVHLHVIPLRIDLRAEFRDHLAVDGHASARNQHLRLPARCQPGRRDNFLQSRFHQSLFFRFFLSRSCSIGSSCAHPVSTARQSRHEEIRVHTGRAREAMGLLPVPTPTQLCWAASS